MIGCFSVGHGLVNGDGLEQAKLVNLMEQAVQAKPYCRCCNVPARKHLSLIKINRYKPATEKGNLTVVCPICYSLHNGGYTHDGTQQGLMIYLPDIKQVELIRLFWALASTVEDGKGVDRQLARDTLRGLEGMSAPADTLYKTTDPKYMAEVIKSLPEKNYDRRADMLGAIRFLPLYDHFVEPLLTYRKSGAFLSQEQLESATYEQLRP